VNFSVANSDHSEVISVQCRYRSQPGTNAELSITHFADNQSNLPPPSTIDRMIWITKGKIESAMPPNFIFPWMKKLQNKVMLLERHGHGRIEIGNSHLHPLLRNPDFLAELPANHF
jgi:hypothetical protein